MRKTGLKEKISLTATAVGSLPHKNPQEAIDFIFKYIPDMPDWPQLSQVSAKEDMLNQYGENIPGIEFDENDQKWYLDAENTDFYEKLEEFFMDYESIIGENNFDLLEKYAISKENSSVIRLFFDKLKETRPKFAKGQVIGPFTWGTSLVDRQKKCSFYDETLRDVIIKGLTLKALWQVNEIKKATPETTPVIFLDEPTMSQFGTSAFITVSKEDIINSINEIADILKSNGAIVGMHCCGKTDWSNVMECNLDVINFDSFFFGDTLSLYSEQLKAFLEKGGMVAWGVIPTLDEPSLEKATVENLIKKFEHAKELLVQKGIDEEQIINQSIITPSCGAGYLPLNMAEKAFKLMAEVSLELQKKYS